MAVSQQSPHATGVVADTSAALAAQVPRLQALMERLRLQAGIAQEVELEDALHALHASATALDFGLLQAQGDGTFALRRAQGAAAAFSLQASRLRAEAARTAACLRSLAAGHASRADASTRLLLQLRVALLVLEKSVGAAAAASATPATVAPSTADDALDGLRTFCAQARRAARLAQERAAGRAALAGTLQRHVVQPCTALQDSLRALLGAGSPAGVRPHLAAAAELRQQLQAGLVQACAEIMRLHDRDHALGARLAKMAHQARLAA